MGGAATTKTLIQNYSALENVLWAGAACVCCMLRTVTPAAQHGTSHPVPTAGPAAAVRTAQQSTEKCKVLRPHCQGKATHFQGGGVLHCKPLGRDACKHKLGNEADAGDCGQLEHPHFRLPCWQAQHPQPCPTHGTMQGRLRGTPSQLQESPCSAQGALAGGQGLCQPYSFPAELSQKIHLCSSPSTTLLMSHLPCTLAQTLSLPHPCPQSLIHSVCKEGDSTFAKSAISKGI